MLVENYGFILLSISMFLTFYFEIIIDSQEDAKIIDRGPVCSRPASPVVASYLIKYLVQTSLLMWAQCT